MSRLSVLTREFRGCAVNAKSLESVFAVIRGGRGRRVCLALVAAARFGGGLYHLFGSLGVCGGGLIVGTCEVF